MHNLTLLITHYYKYKQTHLHYIYMKDLKQLKSPCIVGKGVDRVVVLVWPLVDVEA